MTIFFTNSVLGAALIQTNFSTNPTTVAPGSDGYLQLVLKNVGTSAASNIKVNTMSYSQYVIVDTSGIGDLGSLGNGESTTTLFKFSVSGRAPSGLYTVKFSIDYCDSSCTEINPTAIISVQAPSTLQITSVEPSILAAGETTTLTFNLANSGADVINNIVLSWQMPNNEILPLGLSNRQFIPSLSGGALITIPMNVSVSSSVTPGVYPLTVNMQYFDKSGARQNVTTTIGMKIGGTTDFDVVVQDSSSGTTSLSIANIGVNPATSVAVSIPEQQNFAVSGASSVFLGTLNSGDFGVASFQISSRFANANRSATVSPNGGSATVSPSQIPTARNLNVEISYSDTSGARQVAKKVVSLNPSVSAISGTSATSTRSRGLLSGTVLYAVIALIAVIVVFLVWFFKLRKRKKK